MGSRWFKQFFKGSMCAEHLFLVIQNLHSDDESWNRVNKRGQYHSTCLLLNVHHELDPLFILFVIFTTSFQSLFCYLHFAAREDDLRNTFKNSYMLGLS